MTFEEEVRALRAKYPTHYISYWHPDDYDASLAGRDIPPCYDDRESFYEAVTDRLQQTFDASVGVSWETVDQAVEYCLVKI